MTGFFYSAGIFLLGLAVSQFLFTILVYTANSDLLDILVCVRNAGYITVPNRNIMQGLGDFVPAFNGGLFFTLSAGAGLSAGAFIAFRAWDRVFSRNRAVLMVLLIIWALILISINYNGCCPKISLCFIGIPAAVITAALKLPRPRNNHPVVWKGLLHLAVIILLAVMMSFQISRGFFIDVRDHFLLSQPAGIALNNFYYNYTLYPAEIIKTLDQKSIKTCSLTLIKDRRTAEQLETRLLDYDYLNIDCGRDADRDTDLVLTLKQNSLFFQHNGRAVLSVSTKDFFSDTGTHLKTFSQQCDRHAVFRWFIMLSLVLGLPAFLYIIILSALKLVFSRFSGNKRCQIILPLFCLLIGLTMVLLLHVLGGHTIDEQHLAQALGSGNRRETVAALRTIHADNLEIGKYRYRELLNSRYIPERYWLAKALGKSRTQKAYHDLLILLDDKSPNVVCAAFQAMGRKNAPGAVNVITGRLAESSHWYEQMYAYAALRDLGWKQATSE